MCVSVCLSVDEDIFGATCAIFTNFFAHVAYGLGSVLLQCHCDTLCSSGFADDIMFFYSGPYSCMNFTTKDRFCLNFLF